MVDSLVTNPLVWGLVGSCLTGFMAYRTAAQKNNVDLSIQREAYVDKQLQNLLVSYKSELGELKLEIKELIHKNQLLVEEVFSLKTKINEMEGMQNERKICEPIRS